MQSIKAVHNGLLYTQQNAQCLAYSHVWDHLHYCKRFGVELRLMRTLLLVQAFFLFLVEFFSWGYRFYITVSGKSANLQKVSYGDQEILRRTFLHHAKAACEMPISTVAFRGSDEGRNLLPIENMTKFSRFHFWREFDQCSEWRFNEPKSFEKCVEVRVDKMNSD